MIDGVCGGIAEYFGIDVTIIRILFVLLGLMGGTGLLVYITAMVVMPTNLDFGDPGEPIPVRGNGKRFWGIVLILVGTTILFVNLGLVSGLPWWSFSGTVIFPVLMIAAGLLIVFNVLKKPTNISNTNADGSAGPGGTTMDGTEANDPTGGESVKQEQVKELRRSIRNRKLFGVCGGLADYFSIDATLVRLAFVVLVFASFGWALLVFIALGILMPEEILTVQS